MFIQYAYAVGTMIPCPLWFWYRWLSAAFLLVVFVWSVYNGATFYIDVFGKRFQNELEQLKRDVSKVQVSTEAADGAPLMTPKADESATRGEELEKILSPKAEIASALEGAGREAGSRERKTS